MVSTLKAEFKKLITVRSTYLLVLLALFLTGLFTYLGTSPIVYQEETAEPSTSQQQSTDSRPPLAETRTTKVSKDLPKERVLSHLQDSIPPVSIFIAVAVVLLMGHEFRYNTITYSLTTSNSRSKVLLSKIIVGCIFTVFVAFLAIITVFAAVYAAVSVKDLNLPPQNYDWVYILVRLFGYALGFSLMGLAIITLVRNLIAGVVSLFLLPMIDGLGGALLATQNIEASKVLPFSALNRINNVVIDNIAKGNVPDDGITDPQLLPATVLGATAIFAIYFVGIWAISWYLFLRRDAT